ncbi:MAG TPA: hypothetical protein VMD30_10990 [Tepidisphaeraceae bacterium]|nr:hypothetical protein [Tepidisphaeraceae bacterium]
MSDTWLRIIPSDPNFQPSREAADQARILLGKFLPHSAEVTVNFNDDVTFIDAGGNWEGVKCAACGRDADSWWEDAMNRSYGTRFANLIVTAPCCGEKVSLNDLNYVWPVGFAKFVAQAMNPEQDLTPTQLQQLSDCLGCELRRIWQHI